MTKKEKINRCRKILHSGVSPINKLEDYEFLISIFEGHSEWSLKKGCGVKEISIQNALHGTKCFVIKRIDDSLTDISFMKAISSPSKISEIKKACRSTIKDLISEYRKTNVIYGQTKCVISGDLLTIENTHIDHYEKPFSDVVELWLLNYDIDFIFSKINKTNDGDMETIFTDDNLKKDFIEVHNKNTNLRAVTKDINLSFLRKK